MLSSFRLFSARFWLLSALLLAASPAVWSQAAAITTQQYDNSRTGANLNETALNTGNVNVSTFGKLFTVTLDGEEYTQPLYVPQLSVTNNNGVSLGVHNVLYVASMNNTLYALDADTGATLWSRNYGPPVPAADVQPYYTDISSTIGILSTPVIDAGANTIYFLSRNKQADGSYHQYLNAADITSGAPRAGSPREITATSQGLTFDPKIGNQRAALTLANGNIYIAWASHGDHGPYHGWLMAYNATTLAQSAVYVNTPGGTKGGIWQDGQGLTVDASGNLYLSSGNGTYSADGSNTGNSFVKFTPALGLLDWFTPFNSDTLNANDEDLGSSGLLGLPGTTYIVGGGKQGLLYVANTNNLGHFNAATDNVVQEFQAVHGNGSSQIRGAPIYYNSPVTGPTIYLWGTDDFLRAYQFNAATGLFNTTAVATSAMTAPVTNANGAGPGGFLSLSANGAQPGTGIIWASTPYNASADDGIVQGIVHAFDAATLHEIWNDKMNDARDEIGHFAKFCSPLVVSGKVYVPTFGPLGSPAGSGALVVYGLLPPVPPQAPIGLTATPGNAQVSLSWAAAGGIVSSYNLYRSTTPGGEGATPYQTGLTATTFSDKQVANGVIYYYQVTAANKYGESPKSSEVAATPANIVLLSQGLPTASYTASSLELSRYPAAYAFDGDLTTRWSSLYSDPQWLQVDLGATRAITDIKLDWEHAAGKNYQLQVSNDGTNWNAVANVANNIGPAIGAVESLDYPGLSASGRYVRMYGTARVTQYGYSLYEFQVYGPAPAPGPVITSMNPTSAVAGSAAFPLTITGSGYNAATTVQFGADTLSPSRATLTSTSLTVSVPASDIAMPGAKTVTVATPLPGGGTTTAAFTVTAPPTYSVSGTVSLQWVASGHLAQPMTFTLTPTGSTAGGVTTQPVTLAAADGSFTLTSVPPGTYTLGVKGSKWLRKDISLDTTNGNVTGLSVSLLGGDATGDNKVNALDFLALRAAYGSAVGDGRYAPAADFNCDGKVNALDFLVLRSNYGKQGDP